jgi:outer membrane protein
VRFLKNLMMYRFFIILIYSYSFSLFSQNYENIGIVNAVNESIKINPTIERNNLSIENANGNYLIRKSDFDFKLFSNLETQKENLNLFEADPRFGFVDGELSTGLTNFNLGLSKKFRTGTIAEISLGTRTNFNNFPFDRFNQSINPFTENHIFNSTFIITQPLLRGRGRKVTSAFEKASLIQIESTDENLNFRNIIQIVNTSNAYWRYIAAFKSYNIFKQNEERVRKILEITKDLVKGDKKPMSDITQINAELSNQERLTYNAGLSLYDARVNLGREIGLKEADTTRFKNFIDDFPSTSDLLLDENITIVDFINSSLVNRKDLKSIELDLESREVQLKFYENLKKPQLDFKLFANYGGENFGNGLSQLLNSISNYYGRTTTVGIGLNFNFDLNNNFAKGNFKQNDYFYKDKEIEVNDFKRNLIANVTIACNNYSISKKAMLKAKESLDYHKIVFENEDTKFKNGMTTLLNLVILQERLTFAELEYINSQLIYCLAIINLRFETGSINPNQINKNTFYTIQN